MGLRDSLGRLFGSSPKPAARKAGAKQPNMGAAGSARAQLIADALKVHKTQANMVRKVLTGAITALERDGVKTLRDPDALTRLMTLIQTQRAMQALRRSGPPAPPAPGSGPAPSSKSKVVRR